MKNLYEFLAAAELEQYLDSFQNRLKVSATEQIRHVEDDDLSGIGMSKPEIRRLRQFFKKECPQSTFEKFKKMNPLVSKSDAHIKTAAEKQTLGSSDATSVDNVTSSVIRRNKVGRSESARASWRPSRKLNASLIGCPESDLRHISHVGFDGAVFGDVSMYGDIADRLPVKATNGRHSAMTSSCISLPVSGRYAEDIQYSRDDSYTHLSAAKYSDDEFADFELPDLSIDFGSSLVDEVMQALGMVSNDNFSTSSSDDMPQTSSYKSSHATNNDVPTAVDDDDDGSDTPTETGSDSGSDTETETRDNRSPEVSPRRPLPSPPRSDRSATLPTITTRTERLSLNANIRAPRGIPGLDPALSRAGNQISVNQISVSNKPVIDTSSGVEDTNPLRRLRQNHLMFTR